MRTARVPRRWLVAAIIAVAVGLLLPLAASAFISTGPNGDTTWYWSNPRPQGNNLTAESFVSATTGWAVGQNGTVLKTVDGGATWAYQDPKLSTSQFNQKDLTGVSFADQSTGWIIGLNGLVRRTSDGGSTWLVQSIPADVGSYNLRSISSADANHAIIVGQYNSIFYTTNGGATWSKPAVNPLSTTGQLWSVSFATGSTAFAVGDSGAMAKTTDGGATWTTWTPVTSNTLNSISFAPATSGQTAFAVGNSGTVLRTTDGGSTWSAVSSPNGGSDWTAVDMLDADTLAVAGPNGLIYRTANASASLANSVSWADSAIGQLSTGQVALRAIQFTDSTHAYVVGDMGSMLGSADAASTWASQQTDTYTQLNAVDFNDVRHGWIAGNASLVMASVDGGSTWFQQVSGASANLHAISFADNSHGWTVGGSGVIRHTSNGGSTWASQTSGTSNQFNGVAAAPGDSAHAIAVGDNGTIVYTADGGSSWDAASSSPVDDDVMGVTFPSSSSPGVAFAACSHAAGDGAPGIIKTTDYGQTWSTVCSGAQPFTSISFAPAPDSNIGWAAGALGTIYRTADGGTTWVPQTSNSPGETSLSSISAVSSQTACAVGAFGVVVQTIDGGTTWVAKNSGWGSGGSTAYLHGVVFTDASHGFAVGNRGTILRTTGKSAPQTSLEVDPASPNGGAGWYRGAAPAITLTPDQQAQTYYSWDATTGPFAAYSGTISTTEGNHTLYYYSVNAANREENTNSATVKTDLVPPTAPTAVSAIPFDRSSALISWNLAGDDASGIDHYEVWVTSALSPTPSMIATTSAIEASVMVGDLTPNTEYTFHVVAWDVAGNSSANSGTAAVTTYALPALVSSVSADGPNGDHDWYITTPTVSFTVSPTVPAVTHYAWDSGPAAMTGSLSPLVTTATVTPTNPDGLNDWYVTTPTVTFSVAPEVPALTYYSWDGAASALASGSIEPPSSGTHTLSFWSVDVAGERAQEATRELTLRIDTAPSVRVAAGQPPAPASISATSGLVTDSAVNLSWTPAGDPGSGFDHYEIWDDYVGQTGDTSVLVTGLSPQTTYGYKVYAVSHAGTYYSQSETVTVTTGKPPVPVAPSIVVAIARDGESVNIDWTQAEGSVGYHVWRSDDGHLFSQIASMTGQASTSFTDTGLRSSTRYWYAVSTLDDRGEGKISSVAEPTWPLTAPYTGRPAGVVALSATEGSGTVHLSWPPDENRAVTGYLVTRAPKSLGVETTLTADQVGSGVSPSYDDTTAVNGQTYYYRVYAVDASSTVGFGSVEAEAKPHAAFTGPDIHVAKKDLTSTSCTSCHSAHHAPNSNGDNTMGWTGGGPNEDTTCLQCHSANSARASQDTSSEVGDPLALSAIPIWTPESTSATMTCESCHRVLSMETTATAGLLSVGGRGGMTGVGGTNTGDAVCYSCHGADSKLTYGDMSGFESSAHATVPDPASGSKVKCEECHESHAARNPHLTKYDGYMACVKCHNSSSASGESDILTKLTLNEDANSRHPLLPQDQTTGAKMSCQNCHNTHSSSSQFPLVDPHNPGPTGTWKGTVGDIKNSFCFTCHDGGTLPTNSAWADAVLGEHGATTVTDIKHAYLATNVHGLGPTSDPNAHLRDDMGYKVGNALDCSACHDPHGTANAFGLVSTIKSADASISVSGLLVYKIPAGGYDLRFFCSGCHDFDPLTHDPLAHWDTTQFGTTDCTRCHRHVNTDGTASTGL